MIREQRFLGIFVVVLVLPAVWLTGWLLATVSKLLWSIHPLAVIPAVALALLFVRWVHRSSQSVGGPSGTEFHPGIRVHAIGPSGPVGCVFVLGYMFMFLGYFPEVIPYYLCVVALAAVGAGFLVRKRALQSSDVAQAPRVSPLGLEGGTRNEPTGRKHTL